MGLFGNPFKAITRAVGLPDTVYKVANIVAPVIPLTGKLTDIALSSGTKLVQQINAPRQSPSVTQLHAVGSDPVVLPGNPYAPSGPTYIYNTPGGSGLGGGYAPVDYSYPQQPYYPDLYGGPSPWDYSTGYQTYLTPQYQTSPISSGETRQPWEDLVSLAPLFL